MPIETCVAILVALHKNAVSNDRDSCHDVLQELGNLKEIDRLWASQAKSHQASSHEKDKYDGKECRFEPEFVLKVGVMSSLLCDCGQLGINYTEDCYEQNVDNNIDTVLPFFIAHDDICADSQRVDNNQENLNSPKDFPLPILVRSKVIPLQINDFVLVLDLREYEAFEPPPFEQLN